MLWLCLIIVFMFLSISKTHQKTKTTTGDMLAHFNKYGCCCFLMMWSHIHRPAALHTDSPSLHLENVPNKHTLYSCISNLLKPTFSSCNVTVLFWEDKVNLTKKWIDVMWFLVGTNVSQTGWRNWKAVRLTQHYWLCSKTWNMASESLDQIFTLVALVCLTLSS